MDTMTTVRARSTESEPRALSPVRVLVATDGSEASAEAARTLARIVLPEGVEVRIVTVLGSAFAPSAFAGRSEDDAEAARFVAASVERAVGEVRDDLEGRGFEVGLRHRFGNPAEGILAEACDWGADLIVMGRRALSRPARLTLGSVSDAVTRRSGVPVLIAA